MGGLHRLVVAGRLEPGDAPAEHVDPPNRDAREDRGDFVQAAATYAEAAKLGVNDNERGRAMLAEARSLGKAGQTQKAIEVYKEIQRLPVVDQDMLRAAGVGMGELSASAPIR